MGGSYSTKSVLEICTGCFCVPFGQTSEKNIDLTKFESMAKYGQNGHRGVSLKIATKMYFSGAKQTTVTCSEHILLTKTDF